MSCVSAAAPEGVPGPPPGTEGSAAWVSDGPTAGYSGACQSQAWPVMAATPLAPRPMPAATSTPIIAPR
ncbi:hypothetical protein [Sinomonas atrocyanea]